MALKAAIFDMDGLMFDTEKVALQSWLEIAKRNHFFLDEDRISHFRGTTAAYIKELFDKWYGAAVDFEEIIRQRQNFVDDYFSKNNIPVKPGLYELLQALKDKKYRIAVATSTSKEHALHQWEETGVLPYLDGFVCGDEVNKSKPDPEIFVKAAQKLGVQPEECIILEDSFHGIEAAHAAGGTVVMVPDLQQPDDRIRAMCDYVFDSLARVVDIL